MKEICTFFFVEITTMQQKENKFEKIQERTLKYKVINRFHKEYEDVITNNTFKKTQDLVGIF